MQILLHKTCYQTKSEDWLSIAKKASHVVGQGLGGLC